MRTYRFLNVDVFTKIKFGGNQLAVFVDGRSLSTEEMQKIAQEMNFSETTFVLPPESNDANWKVRIFTPTKEIPFAGHPCVGTAYVLVHEGMIDLKEPWTEIVLELGIGLVRVKLEVVDQQIGFIQMDEQTPTFGLKFEPIKKIAEALSIDVREIEATGLPVEVVSCGSSYLLVPVNSLHTLEMMKPSLALIEEIRAEIGQMGFYIFSQETVKPEPTTDRPDLRVQARMFTVGLGLHEDPATGSAAGPLGCYLVKNGVIPPNPVVKVISEQGYQMERPSTLHIDIGMDGNEIVDVRVGGYSVLVAECKLFVD